MSTTSLGCKHNITVTNIIMKHTQHMQQHVYHFAYGANMSSGVLRRRGVMPLTQQPARPVDPHTILAFRHRAGFATLLRQATQPSGTAPAELAAPLGVLYTLTLTDMDRLRRCEEGYQTMLLPCVPLDPASKPVDALVFSSQPWNLLPESVPPRSQYLEVMCEGAAEAGLPAEYVERLSAVPTVTAAGWGLPDTYYDTPARRASVLVVGLMCGAVVLMLRHV